MTEPTIPAREVYALACQECYRGSPVRYDEERGVWFHYDAHGNFDYCTASKYRRAAREREK
jgi:hypothetical protein